MADKNHVGGRDAGEAGKRWGTDHDSSAPATRKDKVDSDPVGRESPRTPGPRDRVVDRSGGVAWDIPVTRAKGRTRRPNEKADKRSAAARPPRSGRERRPARWNATQGFLAAKRRRAVVGGVGRVQAGAFGRQAAAGAASGRGSPNQRTRQTGRLFPSTGCWTECEKPTRARDIQLARTSGARRTGPGPRIRH